MAGFDLTRSYVNLIRDSHFVLCPRGFGASSIRIFEAMCLGRAPVIIGDAWTRPPGADWERFSVRVAEDQVAEIPERLAALREQAPAMGALAAETFRALYAPEVFLDRLVTFLTERHAGAPATVTGLLARAVAAAGTREFRTLAHQIVRHRP
nr:exostosin family protein [Methylobacterium variabile]